MNTGNDPLFGAQHGDVLNAVPETDDAKERLVAELKRRGNAAFQSKSLREADTLYSKAIEHDPKSHALWGNRSMTRAGMGQFKEALSDAEKALEADQQWAKGYYRKGIALNGLKRFKEAHDAFAKCLELEPNNKVASLKLTKAKAAAEKAAAEKAKDAANKVEEAKKKAAAAKKVVKEATSSMKKVEVSKTTKPRAMEVDDDDEELGEEVRGYKVLADGRKTTFFNRELDEKEKALIGDIRPQKIDEQQAAKVAESMKPTVEGSSAWNKGGTFEERDMNDWAKDRLTEIVKDISVKADRNGAVLTLEVLSIEDLEGDASITFARGKKKHMFDFEYNLKWKATVEDESADDVPAPVEGKLFYMDFTADASDDEEFDVELRWENRHKAGPYEAAIKTVVMDMATGLRGAINERLLTFCKEFRAIS